MESQTHGQIATLLNDPLWAGGIIYHGLVDRRVGISFSITFNSSIRNTIRISEHNTVEENENTSVFSLIPMYSLPPARACGQ